MYQILQKFDIHWHDGGPSIAMMCHLRRVSDLLYNWKSCLLCYMKDVVLHCSIFFKWNKLVRVRVRVRVQRQAIIWTNTGILLIWPSRTNFNEMLIEIHTFSFKEMHAKMPSAKRRPSCLGLNVLIIVVLKLLGTMCILFKPQCDNNILLHWFWLPHSLERKSICSYWLHKAGTK